MIRSQFRPAVIALLVLAVTLPAAAESAKSLYNKGKDAEARQNYEQAYDFYKQAFSQKPQDMSLSLRLRAVEVPRRRFPCPPRAVNARSGEVG